MVFLYTHRYHHIYIYKYIFYMNNWMADPRANYLFYTVSIWVTGLQKKPHTPIYTKATMLERN